MTLLSSRRIPARSAPANGRACLDSLLLKLNGNLSLSPTCVGAGLPSAPLKLVDPDTRAMSDTSLQLLDLILIVASLHGTRGNGLPVAPLRLVDPDTRVASDHNLQCIILYS